MGRFIITGVRWDESVKRKSNRGIYENFTKDPGKKIILNVERQIVANPNIKLNLSFFTLFPQIIPAFSSIPSDYS